MPDLTIIYWRDIPAQVLAKQGRQRVRHKLSERFPKGIDRAAMRAKKKSMLTPILRTGAEKQPKRLEKWMRWLSNWPSNWNRNTMISGWSEL